MNRVNVHANQYGLFPVRQAAYRQHHSTKTAVTIVHNEIVRSTDGGIAPALVMRDLNVAFDAVYYGILLEVLTETLVVENLELDWFLSHHIGRTQAFITPSGSSASVSLT